MAASVPHWQLQDAASHSLRVSREHTWYAQLLASPSTQANVLSALACIWLLLRLRLLPVTVRGRLFPQQVKALGLSNALFATTECISFFMKAYDLSPEQDPVLRLFVGLGFNTALLVELSIAIGFLLQCRRWRRSLRALRSCLWMVWVLGALPAILEVGNPGATRLPLVVHESLLGVCCGCSLVAYCAVLCHARALNDTVKSRCWHRASVYLLNTMITQVPALVVATLDDSMRTWWMVELSGALQGLNGAINALTYFLQSRYSGLGIQELSAKDRDVSFVVQFGDTTVEDTDENACPCEPETPLAGNATSLC